MLIFSSSKDLTEHTTCETTAGKKRTIHFFSKNKPDVGEPIQLPKGYEVKVNTKTGLPYLKKKK